MSLRLPAPVYGGVQGAASIAADQAAAPYRALTRESKALANTFEQEHNALRQERNNSQYRQAALRMSQQMLEFEKKYGNRDYYSPDEIPDNIEVRRTEMRVNPDGSTEEIPRESVPAYEVYPQMYRAMAESNVQASAFGIEDAQTRETFTYHTQNTVNERFLGKMAYARKRQQEFMLKELSFQVDYAVEQGQWDIARGLASEFEDTNIRNKAMLGIAEAEEMHKYDSIALADPTTPATQYALKSAIEDLRNDEIDMLMSPAQRHAKASLLEHRLHLGEAEQRADIEQARQKRVSDTWLGLDRGDPAIDEAYIDNMFDERTISGPQRTAMIRALYSRRATEIEAAETRYDVASLIANRTPVDPRDKGVRKAANEYYQQQIEEGRNPLELGREIMQSLKIVPDPIKSMFRASNRADAPQLAEAAQLWNMAQGYAGMSLYDISDGEVDVIRNVAAHMKEGLRAEDAINIVRTWDNLPEDRKRAVREQTSHADFRATNQSFFNEAVFDRFNDHLNFLDLDWWWHLFSGYEADVGPARNDFLARFDGQVERMLPIANYNPSAARRMAFDQMMRNTRATTVNGDRQLMEFAPAGSDDDVRAAMNRQFRSQLPEGIKLRDVKIAPDVVTQQEVQAGKFPSYKAFYVSAYDEDTGDPLEIQFFPERFRYDPTEGVRARKERNQALGQLERDERLALLEELDQIRAAEDLTEGTLSTVRGRRNENVMKAVQRSRRRTEQGRAAIGRRYGIE